MPPAKNGGMVKWIVIGVIAVVVICCCGVFAISLGSDDTDTSASESTSSSQAESSSETPSAAAATAEESSAKPAEKKKASKSPSSTKAPAPAAPAGADVKITAGEFIKEFEGNELAADQKYKGKTVEVSGVVEKIDTELFNEDKYLLNITDGGDFEFLSVTCHDMDNDVLSKLTVGSAIKVIGDFDDGGDLGVDLKNCKVV